MCMSVVYVVCVGCLEMRVWSCVGHVDVMEWLAERTQSSSVIV